VGIWAGKGGWTGIRIRAADGAGVFYRAGLRVARFKSYSWTGLEVGMRGGWLRLGR
jgi:hypothetical protein